MNANNEKPKKNRDESIEDAEVGFDNEDEEKELEELDNPPNQDPLPNP